MGQQTSSHDHIPNQWQHVRQLPDDIPVAEVPTRSGQPASARLEVDGTVYHRVPDSGFTMLTAWLAGPDNLVRLVDREPHATTVTTVRDSAETTHTESRTSAEQERIDQGIEDYLTDAGVPTPPRGYRWYQRLPYDYNALGDVYAHVNAALRDADPHGTSTHPSQIAPIMSTIVSALYQR